MKNHKNIKIQSQLCCQVFYKLRRNKHFHSRVVVNIILKLEKMKTHIYILYISDVAGKNSLPPFGGFDPNIIRSAESQSAQTFVAFTFFKLLIFPYIINKALNCVCMCVSVCMFFVHYYYLLHLPTFAYGKISYLWDVHQPACINRPQQSLKETSYYHWLFFFQIIYFKVCSVHN